MEVRSRALANWKANLSVIYSKMSTYAGYAQLLQFHRLTKGRTFPESYNMSCDAVICIWMPARIPTASNTGLNKGACLRIEDTLGNEIV